MFNLKEAIDKRAAEAAQEPILRTWQVIYRSGATVLVTAEECAVTDMGRAEFWTGETLEGFIAEGVYLSVLPVEEDAADEDSADETERLLADPAFVADIEDELLHRAKTQPAATGL